MRVKFNEPSEWLDELDREVERIEGRIVRVTQLVVQLRAPIRRLSVVATARVGDTILRVDRYCGELWSAGSEHDAKAHAVADDVMRLIWQRCDQLGLEVRAGIYEP